MAEWTERFPADTKCCQSAQAALRTLGEIEPDETGDCDQCPFPFCIDVEARKIHSAARDMVARLMGQLNLSLEQAAMKLGLTVEELAKKAGVTKRSLYRTVAAQSTSCHWCSVDASVGGVFCRPSMCTIAFDRSRVVVVLSHHRHANKIEVSNIEHIVKNLFPGGDLIKGNSSTHDHWEVTNVTPIEASAVYSKMEFLCAFTEKLR